MHGPPGSVEDVRKVPQVADRRISTLNLQVDS